MPGSSDHSGCGLQFFAVVVFDDREDFIEGVKKRLCRGYIACAEFTLVHGDVGFPNEVEHCRQGLRSVEIVGKAGIEIIGGFDDAGGNGWLASGWKFLLLQAGGEITQALDGIGGLQQAVESEIQLPAIRDRSQQIADRRRSMLVQAQRQVLVER